MIPSDNREKILQNVRFLIFAVRPKRICRLRCTFADDDADKVYEAIIRDAFDIEIDFDVALRYVGLPKDIYSPVT